MKFFKFFVVNLVPILFVMTTIFVASSQTSDQQDISPILDQVTDKNIIIGFASSVMARVNFIAERGILAVASYPLIALISIVILSIIVTVVFFRLFRSTDSPAKKIVKAILYISIVLAFIGTFLFLLKSDIVIEALRNRASFDHIRVLLQKINFTYAGSPVNLQSHGVDGLLNFLLRKAAHFFLFAMLGFFVFLALFKLNRSALSSFIIALMIVIAYAALDEFRQTFILSRSGLVVDVILDTAGGIFGTSMGWLKKRVSKWLE